MNIKNSILILLLAGSSMALAQGQRPDSAGQGKPDSTNISDRADSEAIQGRQIDDEHMEGMEEEHMEGMEEEHAEDIDEHMREDHAKGPDKERKQESKGEEDRTEAGKGSEQGQASREENSRKWWRFWE